jgi:DNA processing protein
VRLSDEQRIDWLRLIRSEGIGPRTFRTLVNRFGGARGALDALPDIARRSGRAVKVASRTEAERELSAAARLGARFIASGEPEYPRTLQAIDTAPPLVAVLGEVGVLARPMVAVVGSRNASGRGSPLPTGSRAGSAARAMSSFRGSHAASMRALTRPRWAPERSRSSPAGSTGSTRPSMPGWPSLSSTRGGAIVSEMPFGWEPRARDFPRRNRIVSGIAYGVVVVEAARRSGSLITARVALEQGREVFAVPGSPLDPRAEGTNDLIRQGANLCAAVEHVVSVLAPLIEQGTVPERQLPLRAKDFEEEDGFWDEWGLEEAELPPPAGEGGAEPDPEPHEERARLVALLSPAPVAVDELARQSGLPIRTVQTIVFELELAGRLERHGANAVSLIGG